MPLTRRTGTPVFMAPELYQRQYFFPADLWSCGMMLYQLVSGRFPFWCEHLTASYSTTESVRPCCQCCQAQTAGSTARLQVLFAAAACAWQRAHELCTPVI